MSKTSWLHPETRAGEILLRNMQRTQFDQLEYATKRIGQQAYDGEGHPLQFENWHPVFINLTELSSLNQDIWAARRLTEDRLQLARIQSRISPN